MKDIDFKFEDCKIIEQREHKLLLRHNNKTYLLTMCHTCRKSILRSMQKRWFYKSEYHFCCTRCRDIFVDKPYKKCKYEGCNNQIMKDGNRTYCSKGCQELENSIIMNKKMSELNFDSVIIEKNDCSKMLIRFTVAGQLYLLTTCAFCRASILRESTVAIYNKQQHVCSLACITKLVGKKRTANNTVIVNCASCDKEKTIHLCDVVDNKSYFCSRVCQFREQKKGGIINKKFVETNILRYGVEIAINNSEIRNRAKQTILQKYGVDNVFKSKEIQRQIRQTIIDNENANISKRSKNEMSFENDFLSRFFDKNDIEIQKYAFERWPIDFYIKSCNLYIQIDGMHWHGLDINRTKLRKLAKTSEHFRAINRKIIIDKQRVTMFFRDKLKLIRISDEQIYKTPELVEMLIKRAIVANHIECFEYNKEFLTYYEELCK